MITLDKSLIPSLTTSVVIGCAFRLIWALLIPVEPLSDSAAYDTFAQNIWLHGTYGWEPDKPYSYWPVGTSAIYALLYTIFGHVYWPIVLLNCALSAGIIYLAHRLATLSFKNEHIAKLTAFLLAVWPTGITFVTILGSELLYMFFSMLGILLFLRKTSYPALVGIAIGLVFSVAYYIRPLITVPFSICIFTLFVSFREDLSVVFKKAFPCALVMILCVAPWALRNYELHNAFVPMSTNSGAVFWMGNQPGSNGGYVPTPKDMADMDTHQRSLLLKEEAINYIKAEPLEFVYRTIYKFFKFHSYETIGITWNERGISRRLSEKAIVPLKILTQGFWIVLVVLAWAGILFSIIKLGFWKTAFNPMTLLWGSNAAIHAIIVSQDRYHIPSVPYIAMFSSFMLWFAVNESLKQQKRKQLT